MIPSAVTTADTRPLLSAILVLVDLTHSLSSAMEQKERTKKSHSSFPQQKYYDLTLMSPLTMLEKKS